MGIANGLENTSDKSFVSHNSNKPFFRTMEDDLKKIKNIPIGNDAAVNASFYPPSAPLRANASQKEFKRSVPTQEIKTVLNFQPKNSPRLAGASVLSVPENLPVNSFRAEKNESKAEEKKEALKSALSALSPNLVKPGAMEDERKNTPVFKPIVPVSEGAFSGRAQDNARFIRENENLSPEARLARQSPLDIIDSGKESETKLAMTPLAGISSGASAQNFKPDMPLKSIQAISAFSKIKKMSIEEVLEEDKSNFISARFVKIFLAVLIVFGIGAGVYYFYIANYSIVNPNTGNGHYKTFIAGIADATIKADLNANSANNIKNIKLRFSGSMPSGIYRLILQDKDGSNNLRLEDFKKSLNIILPDYIANNLEKDYNLLAFNYPEKNYLRLGLILEIKNSSGVSSNFAKNWEAGIYKDLKPIFLDNAGIYEAGKQFRSNKYNNFNIKYLPLGFENIALNYAIDNDKKLLLIATSKDDIFNLIDKLILKN